MPAHGACARAVLRSPPAFRRPPPQFLDRVLQHAPLPARPPAVGQTSIRAAYYRGGTSRAVIIQPRFLPKNRAAWPAALRQIMGCGDAYGHQLDGMGAGQPCLSNICLVEPCSQREADSSAPDAHIDYTFVGLSIATGTLHVDGIDGNLSSAIGPYAYNARLLPANLNAVRKGPITVKIRNTNTDMIMHATFDVFAGQAAVDGDYTIDGVTGPGSKIKLAFPRPYGSMTAKVLPTGKTVDRIAGHRVSCVDGASPTVFIRASDVGVDGTILPHELDKLSDKLDLLERIRKAAAVAMGIAPTQQAVPRTTPKIGLVSQSSTHTTLSGKTLTASQMDIVVRYLSGMQSHSAIPLTAALTTAVAAHIPGTIVEQSLAFDPVLDRTIMIGHADGRLQVEATMNEKNPLVPDTVAIYRTAKRLFEGETFWVDRGGLPEKPNFRNGGHSLGMQFIKDIRMQKISRDTSVHDEVEVNIREQKLPSFIQEATTTDQLERKVETTLRQLHANISKLLEFPSVTTDKFPHRLLWMITRTSTRVVEHARALDHTRFPSTPLTGALLQLRGAIGDLMTDHRIMERPFPQGLLKDMARTDTKIADTIKQLSARGPD